MSQPAPAPVEVQPYAIEVNLNVDIGGSFPYTWIWKEVNDPDEPYNPLNPPTGMDLTNCTAVMEIRNAHESSDVLLSPTVTLEKDGVKGAISIELTEAQIASLLPRKKHVYQIKITFPTGYVRKFSRGRFDLTY